MPVAVINDVADDRGPTYADSAQRLVIDMKDDIVLLEPKATPLTTLKMNPKVGSRSANATKIEWPESEVLPPLTNASASFTNVATSIPVAAGTGAYFRPNDFFRVESTGEVIRVDVITTDTLSTVTRGIGSGGTGIASVGAADKLVRLGNASAQGGSTPAVRATKTVFNFNYTGIQRDPFGVTNSTAKAKMYGGPYLDVARKKASIEHKSAIERQMFFGKRDLKSDSTVNGGTSRPQGFVGGVVGQYITANQTHINGSLSRSNLETALRPIFRYGSGLKFGFCSPLFFSAVSGFQLSALGISNWEEAAKQYGVAAKKYVTGAGDELVLVLKRDWNDYPTASPGAGGMCVVLDLDFVSFAAYRSTHIEENVQNGREDLREDEFLTEWSLECVLGGSSGGSGNGVHGIIDGVTG